MLPSANMFYKRGVGVLAETLGKRIKRLRAERRWQPVDVVMRVRAAGGKLSVSGLYKIEEDRTVAPKLDTLQWLAGAFEVPLDVLVSGTGIVLGSSETAEYSPASQVADVASDDPHVDYFTYLVRSRANSADQGSEVAARLFLTAFHKLRPEEQISVIAEMLEQIENQPRQLHPENGPDQPPARATGS